MRIRRRQVQTLVAACVAAAFVTTQKRFVSTPVGLVTEAVNEVPARLASAGSSPGTKGDASRTGRHLGFDTYAYPGDAAMRAWRHEDVPYEWVGYYLPAPCHKGRTWVGKRERLAEMGWGMAVVYVGQQTWDKVPSAYETTWRTVQRKTTVSKRVKQTVTRNGRKTTRYVTKRVPGTRSVRVPTRVAVNPASRPLDECNANLVSGARGTIEARDAIQRTEAEGFPRGTVIFLDIERMERMPPAMREYYRTWTAHVLQDGRYRPGYYTHKHNAATIYRDVKAQYAKAGATGEPPFWIASGKGFTPDKAPHEVGHSFAAMWQGVLDVVQEWNGYSLPIDVNVAQVRDPSRPTAD